MKPGGTCRCAVVLWLCLAAQGGGGVAEGEQAEAGGVPSVDAVRAVIRFLEWPPERFASAEEPVVLGVLGQAELVEALRQAMQEVQIQGRPVRFHRIEGYQSPLGCHVLLVGSANQKDWKKIGAQCRKEKIITLGEGRGFVEAGGVIGLWANGSRTRITIHMKRAEATGVKISSKLLSLAEITGRED